MNTLCAKQKAWIWVVTGICVVVGLSYPIINAPREPRYNGRLPTEWLVDLGPS
jgi:hypothetical protein